MWNKNITEYPLSEEYEEEIHKYSSDNDDDEEREKYMITNNRKRKQQRHFGKKLKKMKYESTDEEEQDDEGDEYCGREVEPQNKNKIKERQRVKILTNWLSTWKKNQNKTVPCRVNIKFVSLGGGAMNRGNQLLLGKDLAADEAAFKKQMMQRKPLEVLEKQKWQSGWRRKWSIIEF